MVNFRLAIALGLALGVLALTVQNPDPVLPIRFLGGQTPALPLGLWLAIALILGSGSALLVQPRPTRRRWHLQPDPPRPPQDRPRQESPWPDTRQDNPRQAPQPDNRPRQERPNSAGRPPQRDEDWGDWERRIPVGDRLDWDSPPWETPRPDGQPWSSQDRRDRQRAEADLQDIVTAWEGNPPPPHRGGSVVEDALEDIATGWEDWEDEPAPSTYAYRPEPNAEGRQDPIHGPGGHPGSDDETDDSPVYDAEYRVIIPPHDPTP